MHQQTSLKISAGKQCSSPPGMRVAGSGERLRSGQQRDKNPPEALPDFSEHDRRFLVMLHPGEAGLLDQCSLTSASVCESPRSAQKWPLIFAPHGGVRA